MSQPSAPSGASPNRAGFKPNVLVVVVTHNSGSVVGECLASIPGALAGLAVAQTVVVDNASADDTLARARAVAPRAELLSTGRNAGFAAAINAAIGYSMNHATDAVLVLNPDTRLGKGSVPALLEALRQPRAGVAVPRLIDELGYTQKSLRREPTVLRAMGEAILGGDRAGRWQLLGETVTDAAAYDQPVQADWATGAVMMISRECLERVGAWDESFFLYSEETDYCLRVRDAGYRVQYWPDAVATHIGGESNTSPELWSILTRNRIRLHGLRHGRMATAAFRGAVVLNEGIRALLGRQTNRAALTALVCNGESVRQSGLEPDGYVCFSAQDWWYFSRGHSDFQLMTRVARRSPVLLVNSLGMRMPRPGTTSDPWERIRRKLSSLARGLRAPLNDVPGFHVLTPFFLPLYGDGCLSSANRRLVSMQVSRAVRRLGMARPAVVVTLPTAWPVARRLERARTVVYRSDRYSALPEADTRLVAALERDMLSEADVALFASSALMAEEGSFTRNPVLLRHGVDLEQFRPAEELPVSQRFDAIGTPRAGFVGMIDAYTVDLDLLGELALRYPDVQLVLAGPVEVDMGSLLDLPNVHHLGVLPFHEVPSVLAGLDVLLMPWQRNEWIEHCNPIKLKEYLAVGRPVLSTDFPEAHHYSSVMTIAGTSDDFVAALGRLLSGHASGTPEQRRAAVLSESWTAQANKLMAAVEGTPIEPITDSVDPSAAS